MSDRRDLGAVERSARAAGMNVNTAEQYALRLLNRAQPVLPDQAAMPIDDFRIGDRVWVGGTKPGIIVYIGEVHFGTGEWAGVVLDTATGKNDGTVNGRRYFMCEAKRGVFSRLSKLTRSPVTGTSSLGAVSDDPAAAPATTRPTSSSGSRSSAAAPAGYMSTVRSASPALMESRSLTLDIERRTGNNASSPRGSGLLAPDENHKQISSSALSPNGSETLYPRPTHGSGSSSPRRASVDSNHSSQNASAMSSTVVPSAAASSNTLLADDNAAENTIFNVGDRVVVNKKKLGTVKYVGTTDFSSGLWAGVELDEPVGKNDGCVAGTRYFNCKPLYGLFTPIHKLTPLTASTPQVFDRNGVDMGPSLVQRPMQPNDVRSVSVPVAGFHMSSPLVTSQLHGSKTRKSVNNGLHVTADDRRDGGLGSSQQINSANSVEAGEQSLAVPSTDSNSFKTENEEISRRLRQYIEKLEKDKTEVHHLLQEEKRKAEDLQFALEESSIEKSELEAEFEKKLGQIRELEGKLQKEAELTNRLSHELAAVKTTATGESTKVTPTSLNTDQVDDLLDQIEELTHKLSRAETKIKALESSNASTNVKNASDSEAAKLQAEEQIIRVREEMKKVVTEKKLVEKQLSDVLDKSNADNLKMASEIEKLILEKKRLIAENDKTVSELGNTQKRLVEADHLLKEFKDTVDHIEQAHSTQITKYCNHIEALKAEMESLQQAQKQLASYKQQVEKLAEKVDVLSDERESLKKQVETLQSSLNSHRELETEHASCQANLQLLHNKFGQTVKEFEYEKNKLADIVETAKKSLKHKDKQIEQLRDEISRLKKVEQANTAVTTQELTKSLHLIEAQNSVKVAAVTAEEQSLSTAIAEKEEALSKVDFLNSVIMEIQRKNMELEAWKRRHEMLAGGGNGESNVATTATPLQQRLFCDICNIYDQHDTEDCPQQGM